MIWTYFTDNQIGENFGKCTSIFLQSTDANNDFDSCTETVQQQPVSLAPANEGNSFLGFVWLWTQQNRPKKHLKNLTDE